MVAVGRVQRNLTTWTNGVWKTWAERKAAEAVIEMAKLIFNTNIFLSKKNLVSKMSRNG